MLGRYVLITLGIVALFWTGYIAIDLIDKKNELSPLVLFGKEDEKVLVIHRAKEISWTDLNLSLDKDVEQLLFSLPGSPEFIQSIYVSSKRQHVLFESSSHWNREQIKLLFGHDAAKLEFNGLNDFNVGIFKGKIYRNRLYLSAANYTATKIDAEWNRHDKKSSASIIAFTGDSYNVTDIYFKGEGRIEYIARVSEDIIGNQVNDKELFAHVLPKELKNYHFFETDYLTSIDPVFAESPIKSWIDKGLVIFQANGMDVLITDFRESQDPVNSLFDFTRKDPLNQSFGFFQNIELLKGFPKNPKKGFYAYSMDDFVVISSDQITCEKIVADYKLGNTLIQNSEKISVIYGKLPAKVSERYVTTDKLLAKSVKNGLLIETAFPLVDKPIQEERTDNAVATYKQGSVIHDFVAESGIGNFMVLTKSGMIRSYKNGKKSWERNLTSEPIGSMQTVQFFGRNHILITTKNGIHIFDENGQIPNGFPIIVADRQLSCEAVHYNWKNKSYLLGMNATGDLLIFDQNGKRITLISSGLITEQYPPEVWISQRKLFYGLRDNKQFRMYDAETKKEFRNFSIPEKTYPIKKPNELFFIALENGQLQRIDQKGQKKIIARNLDGYKINEITGLFDVLLTKNDNARIIDENGQTKLNLSAGVNQIDFFQLNPSIYGRSIVTLIDGLQNDVYLFGLNGKLIVEKPFPGAQKATVKEANANQYILTSIVDDFIVQYTIN
jgi:hypothetical protein